MDTFSDDGSEYSFTQADNDSSSSYPIEAWLTEVNVLIKSSEQLIAEQRFEEANSQQTKANSILDDVLDSEETNTPEQNKQAHLYSATIKEMQGNYLHALYDLHNAFDYDDADFSIIEKYNRVFTLGINESTATPEILNSYMEAKAEFYEELYDKYPQNVHFLNIAGECYYALKRYYEAEECFEAVLSVDESNSFAQKYKNLIDTSKEKTTPFIEEEKAASSEVLATQQIEKQLTIQGLTLLLNDNIDKALEIFLPLLEKNPNNLVALFRVSEIYERKKEYKSAFEYSYKAFNIVATSPEDDDYLLAFNEALRLCDKCIQVFEQERTHYTEQKIAICQLYLKTNHNNTDIMHLIGDCYHNIGKYREAYVCYDNVLKSVLKPDKNNEIISRKMFTIEQTLANSAGGAAKKQIPQTDSTNASTSAEEKSYTELAKATHINFLNESKEGILDPSAANRKKDGEVQAVEENVTATTKKKHSNIFFPGEDKNIGNSNIGQHVEGWLLIEWERQNQNLLKDPNLSILAKIDLKNTEIERIRRLHGTSNKITEKTNARGIIPGKFVAPPKNDTSSISINITIENNGNPTTTTHSPHNDQDVEENQAKLPWSKRLIGTDNGKSGDTFLTPRIHRHNDNTEKSSSGRAL